LECRVFVLRRKYRTIPTLILSTYLPKSTSFVPTRTELAVKLLTIATERLEKVSLFLRKYHDSKAVALKEYYDYSPISTYTESC
jgi:hypothetical protein